MMYLGLIAGVSIIGLALWSHFTKADAATVASLAAAVKALHTDIANVKAKLK